MSVRCKSWTALSTTCKYKVQIQGVGFQAVCHRLVAMKSESIPGIERDSEGIVSTKFVHVADNDGGGRYGNHRDTYMSIQCASSA